MADRNLNNGRKLLLAFRNLYPTTAPGTRGEALLNSFTTIHSKNGDPYDLRATVVDMMCDVGLRLRHTGQPQAEPIVDVLDMIDAGELSFDAADDSDVAMARAFCAECAAFLERQGHSARDAVWITGVHLDVEVGAKPSSGPGLA